MQIESVAKRDMNREKEIIREMDKCGDRKKRNRDKERNVEIERKGKYRQDAGNDAKKR